MPGWDRRRRTTTTSDEDTMTQQSSQGASAGTDGAPAFRYDAAMAAEIERRWQDRWEAEGTFSAPNPAGPWADPEAVQGRDKLFVLDMFPYPSGAGLHVGHPLGYIGTDVFGRFQRMRGRNVLHALGYDAFGLPAEQYAMQTGQHPRVTTEANIANMRRQLRRLGLAHDTRRSVATTDVDFYRWTQWIFRQVFDAWYDETADGGRGRARPIAELVEAFERGEREVPGGRPWAELDDVERRRVVDSFRLAYASDAPVNWCPGLGTVLANEEVTADGRSDIGNFPVFKRSMRQWMMRITAYADRLLEDLDRLDWPEAIKGMQRNWIGRSAGARVSFPLVGVDDKAIEVFTTRPDTLFGATFMVLAPEHPLLDGAVPASWPEGTTQQWTGGHADPRTAVRAYREEAALKTDLERQTEGRDKTGRFAGLFATNPVTGQRIPVFVADYVLMGYGTGAIMAVPGQDERDWEFAQRFELPIVRTVAPPEGWEGEAYTGDGPAIHSSNDEVSLDGLGVDEAKRTIIEWLERKGFGQGTVTYKLRDWLFSRQRYWGEPFPVVWDEDDVPHLVPESMLPVELPELEDYRPQALEPDDATSEPLPPLARATDWVEVELDLGDGPKPYRRELNVMPQWAGSCWYELRYLDPANSERFVDPEVERYWMGPRPEVRPDHPGGVDLYVGGAEHAVLHLLYARFWHKVLHDLGHVSSAEPFYRLFNQGYIQAYAFRDARGQVVPAAEVVEAPDNADGAWSWEGRPVTREHGKMGKSLKNVVTPDEMYDAYGADTFRLYEMSMGPLDVSRPWETRAVVGSLRFLQRLWRNVVDETTGALRVTEAPADDATRRLLHRTMDGVATDMDGLRFNTAVAKLIELNNHLTKLGDVPREVAEPLVLMLAPLAPHMAEELWARLGHDRSLAYEPFPAADPALLVEDTVTCVVQVAGKVRDRLEVAPSISEDELRELALTSDAVQRTLDGRGVRTVVVRAPRLVNVVPA
jgi:leucyl-tRNA synthetase